MIKKTIKKRWYLLSNPEKGFKINESKSFEAALHEYLILLLIVSILSAISSFLINIIKSLYFGLMYNAEIHYFNMLNYSLGRSIGLMFFYLFAGTVVIFFISLIINSLIKIKLINKKIKYTKQLEILFISMTPILLFGWITILAPTLIIWVIFLIVEGLRVYGKTDQDAKTSIAQRD